MTKTLIAGLATIVVAGAALVGTGMYAANTASTGATTHMGMHRGNPQDLIATLSGKVSPEALTALQTLMTKHKSEMDTMKSNTGATIDTTKMETQRAAFKTEMDALLVQYPELKTAMPTLPKGGMGKKMDRRSGAVDAIIATLPATVQTQLKTIHDNYATKEDALRTAEKTEIDAILAGYPDVKTKLDALQANRPQGGEGRGHRGEQGHRMQDQATIGATSAQ